MPHYYPTAVPNQFPALRSWLAQTLARVASALHDPEVSSIRFEALAAEPAKYQNGDVVYADGTNWDPGSGAGIYARIGGAWSKL